MKPKRRRLVAVAAGVSAVALAVALMLSALDEGISFFFTPSDLLAASPASERPIRLGGLVEERSVVRGPGVAVSFKITDLTSSIPVSYRGLLPDLFREGQGVVAFGRLQPDGSFQASEILAKHDENYLPREVAEALQESGHWMEEGRP